MSNETKFTVPSQVLAAAQLARPKSDVRYYLCGVRINEKQITATNGHYLFDCPIECDADQEYIFDIAETIPVKALSSEFERISDTEFVVRHKDRNGKLIKSSVANVVDGKFPDIEKVTCALSDEPEAVSVISFNPEYIALIGKAFKKIRAHSPEGIRLEFRGNESVILVRPSGLVDSGCKGAYFMLMPTRL